MRPLLEAIYRKLANDVRFRALFQGGIFRGMVPAKAGYPSLSIRRLPGVSPQSSTAGERREDVTIRFMGFFLDDETAEQALEWMKAMLAPTEAGVLALTLERGRVEEVEQTGEELEEDPDRTPDGKRIWDVVLDVRYRICWRPQTAV